MNEGRNKAIPLRRVRGASALAGRSTVGRWSARVGQGVRLLIAPPRQMWLAALGGTALTLRAARGAWIRIVAEGEAAERWLRGHPADPAGL